MGFKTNPLSKTRAGRWLIIKHKSKKFNEVVAAGIAGIIVGQLVPSRQASLRVATRIFLAGL